MDDIVHHKTLRMVEVNLDILSILQSRLRDLRNGRYTYYSLQQLLTFYTSLFPIK